ncbi:hypothetical protein [Pseudonocardia sp.]|uniref:hypothetical protein n=1 Tax=Pseudonocardia sp. TaxID=60912 RepID=UPI0026052C44|nr:hypothetical protein [Pseudonocardia sp.]
MAVDPALLSRRQRLNALQRHRGATDPEVVELRCAVAADALARHVARVLATSPPLTPAQRRRVAELLDVDTAPAA